MTEDQQMINALWSQLSEVNRIAEVLRQDCEGWKKECLDVSEEVLELRNAIRVHRDTPKLDGWGAPKRDADERLYSVLARVNHLEVGAGSTGCGTDARADLRVLDGGDAAA